MSKPRTPSQILADIMEYDSVRHSLGLNHTFERGCNCLKCEAEQVIEKFYGNPPRKQRRWGTVSR